VQFLLEANPDAIVIIAYGQIIPAKLLPIPKHGWINSHGSLLPKYRGAAPIQWAIANGETTTGVTTMRIDAGMDTGEVLLRHEVSIGPQETTPELAQRLAEISAPLMAETLRGLRDGTIEPIPQNPAEASMAPLLKKEDGRINWSLTAGEIFNRMRGFTPWPGAFAFFRGSACQLFAAPVSNQGAEPQQVYSGKLGAVPETPGTIVAGGGEMYVACGGKTLLRVARVKLEGRKEVSAQEFVNGAHLHSGEHFD